MPAKLRDILNVRPAYFGRDSRHIEIIQPEELKRYFGEQACPRITKDLITPGGFMGNHVHKQIYEICFLSGNSLIAYIQDPHTNEIYNEKINPSMIFNFPNNYPHAILNPYNQPAVLLRFINKSPEYEDKNFQFYDVFELSRGILPPRKEKTSLKK
jgi:hypothetical protein